MGIYNPFALHGKTILVTGASSGIGKATAIECSKLGAKVVVVGRNEDRLKETFKNLEGEGHLWFTADLASEDEIKGLVDNVPELQGVVLAAGVGDTTPFQFVKKDKLERIFNINFYAPVLLAKTLIKKKRVLNDASLVFISSIDGPVTTHIGNSIYSSTKGALSAMVKGMAVDLASKKIRVNAVLPGMTETPLIHRGNITEEQMELDKQLYPLKRYGTADEIAHACIFFLSDACKFATGANLVVDGGFTLL